MRHPSETRRAVRLKTESGVATLHFPELTPLTCPIADISFGGCKLYLNKPATPDSAMDRWTQVLIPGRRVECELHHPPEMPQADTLAVVCHAEAHSQNCIEIGLAFVDVSNSFDQVIHTTLQAMAAQKIASGKSSSTLLAATKVEPAALRSNDERHRLAGLALSDILAAQGVMSRDQFESASISAAIQRLPVHRYLLKNKLVTAQELCRAEALASRMPITTLHDTGVPPTLVRRFKYLELLRYECVPFAETDEALSIAAVAPLSPEAITAMTKECGKEVLVFLAPATQVQQQLARMRPRPTYDERKNARQLAMYAVHCHFCDVNGTPYSDGALEGMTLNVSANGLQIVLPAPEGIPCNELLERTPMAQMTIHTPSGDIFGKYQLRHVKLRVENALPDLPLHIGLQLANHDPIEVERMKRLCATLAVERMRDRKHGYREALV